MSGIALPNCGCAKYRELWKLDPNGNIVWTWDNGWSAGDFCIDSLDKIYVSGVDQTNPVHTIWKLNSDSSQVWAYSNGLNYGWTYGICTNGLNGVYQGAEQVYKVDNNGNLVWRVVTNQQWPNVFCVATDLAGNVYATGDESRVWGARAIRKLSGVNGSVMWEKYASDLGGYDHCSAVKGDSAGNVYVGSGYYPDNGRPSVFKLDGNNGNQIWNYVIGTEPRAFLVGSDGVYVSGYQGYASNWYGPRASFWKLSFDGALIWAYDTGSWTSGAAFDSQGNVYTCGDRVNGKAIWKFSPTGTLLASYDFGFYCYSIALDSTDNMYVITTRVLA